ncbi:MAG: EAL domain-containing protein [Treponema sp.]|nr:EAL domain-containing protein [Treponema sp.]
MTNLEKKLITHQKFFKYALISTILICALVISIGVFFFTTNSSIKINIDSAQPFGYNWYSAEEHKLLSSNYIYIPEGTTVHLSKTIPEEFSGSTYIAIWNFYNYVTAGNDNKIFYSGGTNNHLKFGNEFGGTWQFIPLEKSIPGKTLNLSITNVSRGRNFYLSSIYIGTKEQIILTILGTNYISLLGILVILIISVLLFCYSQIMYHYGVKQYSQMIHSLVLLSLTSILYILFESSLAQFIISNPSLRYMTAYIVAWLLPVMIVLFYRKFFADNQVILPLATNIYLGLISIWYILYFANIVHLDYFYIVYVFIVVCFTSIFRAAIKEYQETHDILNIIAALAILVLFFGEIIGIILYYTNTQAANIVVFQHVYVIFLIILIGIVLKKTFTTIAKASSADYYKELAFSDNVTGGHSQAYFEQTFENLITEDSYFLFINFKRFKLINEIVGYEKSNSILKKLYEQVELTLKNNELLCNLGNAHFGILLNASSENELYKRCEKIIHSYSSYLGEKKLPYKIRTEIGAVKINIDNIDFNQILDDSIISLNNEFATTNAQQDCFIFHEDCKQLFLDEKNLEENFENALAHHEFKLYLQPKIDIKTNKIYSAEALARWDNPEKGILTPYEFVPILEKLNKIDKLDLYLFNQTCLLIKQWISEDIHMPKICVNLSHLALNAEGYFDNYVKIIKELNLPGEYLEFEISENSTYDNLDHLKKVINTIHEMGSTCTLDDFGKSYSNLSILGAMNFDNANLASNFFINKFPAEPKQFQLINGTVNMLKAMNLKISAIGIETENQLKAIKEMGCDYVQGYIYSKPLTVYEFENYVKAFKIGG